MTFVKVMMSITANDFDDESYEEGEHPHIDVWQDEEDCEYFPLEQSKPPHY